MKGQSPILTPMDSGELQSSITLFDFFRAWYGYRYWYLIGFFAITLGTLFWTKYFLPTYYKAESKIFVGRQMPTEQRVGFADILGLAGQRNEQYQNLTLSQLAEQTLLSADFLLDVAEALKKPDPAYGNKPLDLYGVLAIKDTNPDLRKMKLVQVLRTDLLQIRQVQNTGLILLGGEMTTPYHAKRFVDTCVKQLQEKFTDMDFGYYDAALKLYRKQLEDDTKRLDQRAVEHGDWMAKHQYDANPDFRKEKDVWDAEIESKGKWLATLRDKISKLELATNEKAKAAAQTVRVVDWANLPLKVSRPKSGLNAAVAGALYTFLFMIGLVSASYLSWSRQQDQATRVHPAKKMDR